MITLKHTRGVKDTYLNKYTAPANSFVRVDDEDVDALLKTGQFERLPKPVDETKPDRRAATKNDEVK